MPALLVVLRVILAIAFEATGEQLAERGEVVLLRVPIDVERLDLGAQEVVGATRAQFGETLGVVAVDEAQDFLVALHRADEAFLLADLPAQPGENLREDLVAFRLVERLDLRPAERLGVAALRLVFLVDVLRGALDEVEGACVANFLVVVPRDEPVLAHHDGLGVLGFQRDLLHRQPEFKAGPHPLDVFHLAAENLLRQFLATLARRNRDDRVRVHVIDVLAGDEAVQRRVDAAGARVEVEGGVEVHGHHVVLGLRLEALVVARGVHPLQAVELVLVERGEILALAGAQVAAATLYPQDLHLGVIERVGFHDLGRGVTPAGVGNALVAAEQVGAVDQAADGIERGGFGVVPEVVDELVGFHREKRVRGRSTGVAATPWPRRP